MLKINLASGVEEKKSKEKSVSGIAVAISVGILTITILVSGFIFITNLVKNIEIAGVERKIDNLKTDLEPYKELEETVLSLEEGLKAYSQITSGEYRWAQLLPHLESATPKDTSYIKLKMTKEGAEADLKGRSVDSIAKLVDSYRSYETISITGQTENRFGFVMVDGKPVSKFYIKPDGRFSLGVPMSLKENHKINLVLVESKDKLEEQVQTISQKYGTIQNAVNKSEQEKNTQTDNTTAETADSNNEASVDLEEIEENIEIIELNFTAEDKKIEKNDSGSTKNSKTTFSSTIEKLFSEIEATEYRREKDFVNFKLYFKFNGSLIW